MSLPRWKPRTSNGTRPGNGQYICYFLSEKQCISYYYSGFIEIYTWRWQTVLYVPSPNAVDLYWWCTQVWNDINACYARCSSWSEVCTMFLVTWINSDPTRERVIVSVRASRLEYGTWDTESRSPIFSNIFYNFLKNCIFAAGSKVVCCIRCRFRQYG